MILFYHVLFFFFLINLSYFLIAPVITQTFNPIAELVVPIWIPIKETKAENVEAKIVSVDYNSKHYKIFYGFYSSIYFALFLQGNNFLFHLYFSM